MLPLTPPITESISRIAPNGPCTDAAAPRGQECLLAITDGGLTALRLPSLGVKAQAYRTSGAQRFLWLPERSAVAVARAPGIGKHARCEVEHLPSHGADAELAPPAGR